MPKQYYRDTTNVTDESDGILRRLIKAITPAWAKVKTFGKALVGGTIYYYGNRIFWGGETSRYLYKRYRTIFQRMGFVRQAILAYKHRIVADKPKILAINSSVMSLLEHRFKQIGVWEHYGWIAQDLLEFGDSFTEIVYSKPNYKIIGLKRLEPDYMYIQRDPYGRPILYISVIDGIPITIEPYRMMHIKMDAQPGDAFGVGLIEGGMDDLAALRILEDLNIQLVKHNIYPHRVYTCPSDEIVQAIEQKLATQARFGDLVVPDGVKAQQMNSGTSVDLRGYMLYYQQKFFLDTGVPMDMLIKGTGGNRSTAAEMSSAFNGNARAIRKGILTKIEWLGELILALEGVLATIQLIPPEIDKALEFARRKEYRELYQEGLSTREFTQELLGIKHPLNEITVPENFNFRLSQEKNWMEQFKLGLMTRPYAIKLLGHDVPSNRPAQPQTPQFKMPQPQQGGQQTGERPQSQLSEPDMIDPASVKVVNPEVQNTSDSSNVSQGDDVSPKVGSQESAVTKRNISIGLKSIKGEKMEGVKMTKKGDSVQTVYIRKVNDNGEIEEIPYTPVDVSVQREKGHEQPNPKWQSQSVDNDDSEIDGDDSGLSIAPTHTATGNKPLLPRNKKNGYDRALQPNKAGADFNNDFNNKMGYAEMDDVRQKNQDLIDDMEERNRQYLSDLLDSANAKGITIGEEIMERKNQKSKALKDDEMQIQPRQEEQNIVEPNTDEQGMSPDQQEVPQDQSAPSGKVPKIPGYFKEKAAHPRFADIFGDNEYSIKKPQRHVERIREEMIDAYGQKHKRIHERTREHHRPVEAQGKGSDSPFIRKKKAAVARRWMKKSPTQLKQGKIQEPEYLAYIDVCFQADCEPWIEAIKQVVISAIDTTQKGVLACLAKSEEMDIMSNQVVTELLLGHDKMQSLALTAMNNLYAKGVNFAKDIFAYYSEINEDASQSQIKANLAMLEERFVLDVARKLSEKMAGKSSVTQLRKDVVNIFDDARMRCGLLATSAGYELYRTAFISVMQLPDVVDDISAIEFVIPKDLVVCKSCQAHNTKVMSPNWFKFEPCYSCNSIYRIHFKDEE